MTNIASRFLDTASRCGRKRCIIQPNRAPLGFDQLEGITGSVARRLQDAGGAPGSRILVQVEKSIEGVVLYLAALRAGLIYVPLNTAYTADELEYFIGDAEPSVIVCDPHNHAALEQQHGRPDRQLFTLDVAGQGSLFEDLPDHTFDTIERADDELACILYTSGTTGRSKGAMLSHGNLASNALALHDLWRWSDDDVLVHILPIFHVHGLFVALHGALLAGATMLFHRKFDVGAVLRDLPRATVFMGVPTHYVRLLDEPTLDRVACTNIRLFTSGSAPLLAEVHERFAQRTGHAILERYGMTETGMITSNPYDGQRVAGTVGFPLPGIEVRIVDGAGSELEAGQNGVLEVRGPNVFKGYWRNTAKTREEFRADGYFSTGDIAQADAEGRITLVGRAKDLIISGGLNVYPKEVEELINAMPGVGECAVIGVPHRELGEGVVAIVTQRAGDPPAQEQQVLTGLAGRLARFKQPKRIVLVDELPRNAMGKIQKAELRKRFADLLSS